MNVRSINFRLTLWYTVLILTASVAFGAYTYLSFEHRLYTEIQNMLASRIEHLRDDVLPTLSSYTRDTLRQKVEEVYSPEQNDRFVRISKMDGTVLYVSGHPRENTFNPDLIPPLLNYTTTITEGMQSLRTSDHLLLVGYVTKLDNDQYILEMGTSITPVISALHKLIVTLLIGLPIVVLIAVLGGSALVSRALQPVEDMRETAEQISFSNLRQRLPLNRSGDAIEQLAKTLNQMLERLDQAYQQASRFSADASHELRTPLAIMRSELETILNRQDAPLPFREHIGSVLEENERLSNIVDGLFSLARLDAGEAKIDHKIFDIAQLTCLTLEQMQLLAEEKSLSVKINAPLPIFVKGDAGRLKQVIVNILDNAIKYSIAGGSLSISILSVSGNAVLTVEDNGIGIPQEALPHIFERFYRADKVRSRTIQGAGLGLSIVRSICQAHGGTVDAKSRESLGTVVTVELPLSTKPNTQI